MLNHKAIGVLAVLALVGAGAAIWATRPTSGGGTETPAEGAGLAGKPALPELAKRAGDVAQITVKRAPMEFNIKKDGDVWHVVEKANYPAKDETVRQVVVGLSQLTLDEPKTSRPDQYTKLGVEDPVPPPPESADKAVPQSALVTLKDAAGQPITSVILGNPKYGAAGVSGTSTPQLYIRKAGDKQAWLVTGQVDVPREATGWLESKFADIKRERVKSVTVTQPDGSVVAAGRDNQSEAFKVQNVPAGRELKDAGVGESIAGAMTGLTFQDVVPAGSIEATAAPTPAPGAPAGVPPPPTPEVKPGPKVQLRTFDGLVVDATSVTKEAKAWWTLKAGVDEALVSQLPPTDPAKATGEDKPAPGAPPKPPSVGTAEAVRKEVADLNAAWAPYEFAPADWKVRSLNSTMADLLKEPTPPPVPAGAPGSPVVPTPPGAPGGVPTPATP